MFTNVTSSTSHAALQLYHLPLHEAFNPLWLHSWCDEHWKNDELMISFLDYSTMWTCGLIPKFRSPEDGVIMFLRNVSVFFITRRYYPEDQIDHTYILIYFLLRFQKETRVKCHERVAKVTGSGV